MKAFPVGPPVKVVALAPDGIASTIIKVGDALKSVDGKPVGAAVQGTDLLKKATEKFTLVVVRDGADETIELFKPEASTKIGITLGGIRAKVYVTTVADDGAAAGWVKSGDQLTAINGTILTDEVQATTVAKAAVGDVVYSILRGSEFITVTVNKAEATTKLGVTVKNITDVATTAPNQIIVREGPPPGAPANGGQWMYNMKYVGPDTKQKACLGCLCCGVVACLILACPSDERDEWHVPRTLPSGAVITDKYDQNGKKIGDEGPCG